jgi:hypothetical protein
MKNFFVAYRHSVDSFTILDNSGDRPTIIAIERKGMLHIIKKALYVEPIRRYEER